jgi:Family of unknown function (DUF5675)
VKCYLASRLGDMACTGILTFDGAPERFYSIELPWRNNDKGASCVPAGTYDLIPYNSPKHGPTWCLHNPLLNVYGTEPVPAGGRDHCEIHSANFARQLLGCIALGEDEQPMLDPSTGSVVAAVEGSRDAIARLLTILGPMSQGHTLTITRETE